MLLKCRNHRFRNTTAVYHHSPTNADDATDLECQGDYLNEGETVEDNDEYESGEEITGLEEVVTSVVNDLSDDYTDDEDDDDYDASELQPLSAPLTCKITKVGSQQHENIHDTEPFEESQIHRPRCNDVQSAKGSHSLLKTNSPREKEIKKPKNQTLQKYSENTWGDRLFVQTGFCKAKSDRTSYK